MQAAGGPVEGLHKVASNQARLIGQPRGRLCTGGVQQRPRRLYGAAGNGEVIRLDAVPLAGAIRIHRRPHVIVRTRLQLQDGAVGLQRAVPRGQRLGDEGDVRGALVQARAAAAAAAAVVARRAAIVGAR